MECAEAFAKCSTAARLQVGSVIVKNNRIISCGYNALPEHIDGPLEKKEYMDVGAGGWLDPDEIYEAKSHKDEVGRYKLTTKKEVRHSEKNALMGLVKSNESAQDASLFCTHACCYFCAVDIVDSGIKEFYYSQDYRCTEGIEYLQKNGVEVYKI
jgi:dCMP deaminase